MNYLTNYYKNLSEQLQEKVNVLESYLYRLNEELESETVIQGPGAGAGTGTTTTNQTNTNSDLNNFLQAWGSSNPTYDYNRDGVVDGDDLGVFLAGMLNRGGSSPVTMASTVAAATPGAETLGGGAKTTRRAKALDQPGLSKGPVNRMVDFGQGAGTVEKKNQTTQKLMPKTPYSQGTNLSTAKFSQADQLSPSDVINAKFATMSSKKGPTDLGPNNPPPTSRPKAPYVPNVTFGTDTLKGRITPTAGTPNTKNLGDGEQEPPQPPPTNPYDLTGDGVVGGDDLGLLLANWGNAGLGDFNGDGAVNADDLGVLFANYTQLTTPTSQPPQSPSEQNDTTQDMGGIPYWMSGKSTNVDTGFRSMQRRRRK